MSGTVDRIAAGRKGKASSHELRETLRFSKRGPNVQLAGRIEGELVRTGRPVGMADTMIAAVALTQGLELSSGNTAHFQRVQQLGYPLIVVNWRL